MRNQQLEHHLIINIVPNKSEIDIYSLKDGKCSMYFNNDRFVYNSLTELVLDCIELSKRFELSNNTPTLQKISPNVLSLGLHIDNIS